MVVSTRFRHLESYPTPHLIIVQDWFPSRPKSNAVLDLNLICTHMRAKRCPY